MAFIKYIQPDGSLILIETISGFNEKINSILDTETNKQDRDGLLKFIIENPSAVIIPKNARCYDPESFQLLKSNP